MEREQLNVITGMVAGVEAAIVHLVMVLDGQGVLDRLEVASSFRETADAVPADAINRQHIQMVLRHVAVGIGGATVQPRRKGSRRPH